MSRPEKVKNILVVRQHNQIGDIIVSVPMFAALKKKFPNASLALAAAQTNYPVPFLKMNPYLSEAIVFDRSSLINVIKFFIKLRKTKFDIGIVPSTIKISRTSHLINYLSGAKIRIGVRSVGSVSNKSSRLLNIKSDYEWIKNNIHQIKRNLDVVQQIGCFLSEEEINDCLQSSIQRNLPFAEKFIHNQYKNRNKPLIGIHVGAGQKKNIWPALNYFQLIEKLLEKFALNLLITCGPLDSEIVEKLSHKFKKLKIKYVVEKEFELNDLTGIISKMDLFITNNTGTMHIAGTTGVNMISLFTEAEAAEWNPYGENKFYVQSKTDNINDISVNEVLELALKILNKQN